jgi:hypothetical protein
VALLDKKLKNYDTQQNRLYNELGKTFKKNYESLKRKDASLNRKMDDMKKNKTRT